MRIILMFFLIFCISQKVEAQLEFKWSPLISFLGNGVHANVEYGITPQTSLELEGFLIPELYGFAGTAKYYLNPKNGLDRLHIGLFIGTIGELNDDTYKLQGVGLQLGYKVIGVQKVVFEIAIGSGYTFNSNDEPIIPIYKLHLGYRL